MAGEAYGAPIERGQVVAKTGEGLRIASYDRSGVITPPLPMMAGAEAETGERVYFFMFDDGRGMVIARMTEG